MQINNNNNEQNINLINFGFNEILLNNDYGNLKIGRITAVHRGSYQLISSLGFHSGTLKSSIYYKNGQEELYPTVGDYVLFQYNPLGNSLICETLPRKSCFTRRDPDKGRGEQAVAANFDYVFILTSLNHDFNPKRLERYITEAWQSGGNPIILLTKADLKASYEEAILETEKVAPSIPIYPISSLTGFGFDNLSPYIKPGKTIALLGSSGVGKSSFVNTLASEPLMKVNSIRDEDSKGRHTTTHRQLISLPSGVSIIDTPGMRSLGMWDVSEGLGEAFNDIEDLIAQCKFSNCTHQSEPGCAIQGAIASKALTRDRFESYEKLKREARYVEKKEAANKRRAKKNIKKY